MPRDIPRDMSVPYSKASIQHPFLIGALILYVWETIHRKQEKILKDGEAKGHTDIG